MICKAISLGMLHLMRMIFLGPPSFDEEIYFDDTLLPIYDDYCDDTYAIKNKFLQVDHDKNDSYDSYFVEFAPTTIDFAYVGSNNFSMFVDHDKKVLCDTYIVEFVHDPTEIFYEKGTYAYRYFNNIKFPLFMLKVLKLHLFFLLMLIALCFNELFYCKFLCIGIMLDLNVFVICFLMPSFMLQFLYP